MGQFDLQIAHDYLLRQTGTHLSWRHFAKNTELLPNPQLTNPIAKLGSTFFAEAAELDNPLNHMISLQKKQEDRSLC